jgi:hypothetical protein
VGDGVPVKDVPKSSRSESDFTSDKTLVVRTRNLQVVLRSVLPILIVDLVDVRQIVAHRFRCAGIRINNGKRGIISLLPLVFQHEGTDSW